MPSNARDQPSARAVKLVDAVVRYAMSAAICTTIFLDKDDAYQMDEQTKYRRAELLAYIADLEAYRGLSAAERSETNNGRGCFCPRCSDGHCAVFPLTPCAACAVALCADCTWWCDLCEHPYCDDCLGKFDGLCDECRTRTKGDAVR